MNIKLNKENSEEYYNIELNNEYYTKEKECVYSKKIEYPLKANCEPVLLKLEFFMKQEDFEELNNLCKEYKVFGGIHELLQYFLVKENGDEFDVLISPHE